MRLTLCENMRAVPYVPFYLALAGGYWKSEGLDIRHVVSPSTSRTATALLEGSVDVSWGGPMRVMMHHDADPACSLVCFGQVVARDPFLLGGRTRKAAFRWHDLVGLRVAPAGDVPTPWMTFQDDLQRAGVDPVTIAGNRVRPMARNLAAYRRGAVDVVQVFEPYADSLVSEGRGHVWHRFTERGDIAYTTFYAPRRFTRARREACGRLVRGMARAQAALFAATPAAIAEAVASFLPKLSRVALTRIIGAYRASDLWAKTPELPPSPYLRLKAALISGGLIRSDPPYERLVDTELSQVGA
ncbi:MAG TPA: ABC transporter substrate-binding protein [Burkholderiales bacterium]|nr:ABC transporter substrate-binding protein [Burkholderiales bacterium]